VQEETMRRLAEEIASQPDCWRRALELSSKDLPEPGERVAVIGCGSSLYIAQAFAALRESAGLGETDAFTPSGYPASRYYDVVIAITRSGTTTEAFEALHEARQRHTHTLVITADPTTPVCAAADSVISLDFADEQSAVQTRFATTGLVLLRGHLGLAPDDLPEQAARALTAELPHGVTGDTQFTFLGTGWTHGIAGEAALNMLEASGCWAESYPAREYRRGPISAAGRDSLVWFLGEPPTGLPEEIARIGALTSVTDLDPLADLIRVQRLAVQLAELRNHDPNRHHNLSRSLPLSR
jgi:fructoselysine-6-P-deglycase FrlB-like protein